MTHNKTSRRDHTPKPDPNSYLHTLLGHWHSICMSDGTVYKQHFRPQDFGPYLAKMAMLKYIGSIDEFEIRLAGSNVIKAFGLSPELKYLSLHTNILIKDKISRYAKQIISSHQTIFEDSAVPDFSGHYKPLLVMPFADQNTQFWTTIVLAFDRIS